jgi:hypothetical protein
LHRNAGKSDIARRPLSANRKSRRLAPGGAI